MESIETLQALLPTVLLRAGVAVLCGGIVGIERELRRKPAGFRTNILICLGSALFMMISMEVAEAAGEGRMADPGRVAAQVVTGIGFLGAGTIIRARGNITGLTSAAMIWLVASIGLWIGAGYPLSGLILTVLTVLTFTLLGEWERRMLGKCNPQDCQVLMKGDSGPTRDRIEKALKVQRLPLTSLRMDRTGERIRFTFPVCSNHPTHRSFLSDLWEIPGVQEIRSVE